MPAAQPQPMRVLIVEDHKPLRQALALAAAGWGAEVLEAGTVREGIAKLTLKPDIVLVDVALPDGNVRPIVQQAVSMRPGPAVIAMSGQASPEEAFELCRIGVRKYLPKPISLEDLTKAVEFVLHERPDVRHMVAWLVGRVPMRDLLDEVRDEMVSEALAIERGSRSGAARRLGVSRQAVQQAVRMRVPTTQREERRERD